VSFGKKEHYQFIGCFYPKKVAAIFTRGVATIRPVLRLLKQYKLVVIGDREYRSTAFAIWLNKQKIFFILRLNKNTKIKPSSPKYQSLESLDIKPGDKVLYPKVLVTEEKRKERFNVVVYCQRKYNNKQLPFPLVFTN